MSPESFHKSTSLMPPVGGWMLVIPLPVPASQTLTMFLSALTTVLPMNPAGSDLLIHLELKIRYICQLSKMIRTCERNSQYYKDWRE